MKRHHSQFLKYEFILSFGSFLIKMLPKFIVNFFWNFFNSTSGRLGLGIRYILATKLFNSIGKNVYLGKDIEIINMENLKIGSNVSIHRFCYIDSTGYIEIGDNVSIAHHSSILSSNHSWDMVDIPIKYNPIVFKKTIINNDVWIAAGVRVLSGSIISERTIIAANAVVTNKITGSGLYGGIPAKKIKNLV